MKIRVKPDFNAFKRLVKRGNLIPVYAEFLADLETPVSSLIKMSEKRYAFLLESVERGRSAGRYSILATDPIKVFYTDKNSITIESASGTRRRQITKDPLHELKSMLSRYRYVADPRLPRFAGGAVGYLAYDLNRYFEKIPRSKRRATPFPESFFMIAETIVVFDHAARLIKVVSNVSVTSKNTARLKASYEQAKRKISGIAERLAKAPVTEPIRQPHEPSSKTTLRSNFTKNQFKNAVKKIKHYIRHGEVIQTVLSQRWKIPTTSSALDIYRALRTINPSPYMFYMNCGTFSIVGSSPEMHVRCEESRAHLRPIAGTKPRGNSEESDRALAKELLEDPKERAEHVMLVDLGRNDLGRVCQKGSVQVKRFMTIERYSHVMHIVSHIEGKLLSNKDIYDVIRATFPAGTVSGAPKIRAMQIIHELEQDLRGPYAGLVGYFSFSGNLDSCITIRTMLLKGGFAYIQAGAGIVADSDPDREWEETKNKAHGLLKALEAAERETS